MVVPYGVRPYVGATCNDVLNYMQCLPGQTLIAITAFLANLIKINVILSLKCVSSMDNVASSNDDE